MAKLKELVVYVLLGMSLLLGSSGAFAQSTQNQPPSSSAGTTDAIDALLQIMAQTGRDVQDYAGGRIEDLTGGDVVSDVEKVFGSVLDGLTQYSNQTREAFSEVAGPRLLGGLAVIALSLLGFQLMLEAGNIGAIMTELIQFTLRLGIAVLFLNEFMLWFDQYLFGTFRTLADMAMPNFNSSSPEKMFTAIPVNFIQLIASSFSNLFDQGWMTIFTKLLPTLLMTIFLSLLLLIASLISLVAALATFVMMQIGLAVGPIVIPFLVLQRTQFIFDGWLRFMITAGMTFLVISLLTGMMTGAMTSLMGAYTSQAASLNLGSLITLHGLLPTLLAGTALGMLTAHLMMKAPDIAHALINGGSEGMGRLGQGIQGSGHKVGNNAHNIGARGVGMASSAAKTISGASSRVINSMKPGGGKSATGTAGAVASSAGSGTP